MTDTLPRWDTAAFYPSLASREFVADHEASVADVGRLTALYDEHDVRGGDPRAVDDAAVAAVEAVLTETNAALDRLRLVQAFVALHVTADARDDEASARQSELRAALAPLSPLLARLDAWVASFGADELAAASSVAADHAHHLRRAETAARHQLTEPEEDLAAELNLTGGSAWTQLHGDVTSRLTAVVGGETLPITAVRNLAFDADASTRRTAYDAELAAWDSVGVTLAACMNGVKGQSNTLNRRRSWADALEPALFVNAVERSTLEAMHAACEAALPRFRAYLAAKARRLGHADGVLPWWDLFAPVGEPEASAVTWDEACAAVERAFASFSPNLRGLAQRAFAERWVDAGPRDGKRGGAFCMSVRDDVSRILMNFGGTVDSVSTLAHELGHAYHNTCLADRTALQRQTPMALAETASIFCETILVQALLEDADPGLRLALLETDLQGATQVVVDIHSRFLFERSVFERRAHRALSVRELCDEMVAAQRAAYGDALGEPHPYMWAVKPHYYSTAFYNWPYTFGLLFGIGLYARYREDPDRFRVGYDDLLSATGLGTAAELAGRFGIDVDDEAFWTASLDVIGERVEAFAALADG